jgi:hypothetical protein
MKVYCKNRGRAPLIINLCARKGRVVNIKPRPLYLWEKKPLLPEYEVLTSNNIYMWIIADPSGHALSGVILLPLVAGIADLNPARGMDVCLLWVLCVVR